MEFLLDSLEKAIESKDLQSIRDAFNALKQYNNDEDEWVSSSEHWHDEWQESEVC